MGPEMPIGVSDSAARQSFQPGRRRRGKEGRWPPRLLQSTWFGFPVPIGDSRNPGQGRLEYGFLTTDSSKEGGSHRLRRVKQRSRHRIAELSSTAEGWLLKTSELCPPVTLIRFARLICPDLHDPVNPLESVITDGANCVVLPKCPRRGERDSIQVTNRATVPEEGRFTHRVPPGIRRKGK